MEEEIRGLRTPEECEKFAAKCSEYAKIARRKAIELRTSTHGNISEVEKELYRVLYAYEDLLTKKNRKRTIAARTRQMVKKYGIIETAEKAVNRKVEAMGYKVLVDMGYGNLTFESVIVRYSEAFNPLVVELAKSRLEELEKIQNSKTYY